MVDTMSSSAVAVPGRVRAVPGRLPLADAREDAAGRRGGGLWAKERLRMSRGHETQVLWETGAKAPAFHTVGKG